MTDNGANPAQTLRIPTTKVMEAFNRSFAEAVTGSLADVGTTMARALASIRLADAAAVDALLSRIDYWRNQTDTGEDARAELTRELPAFEWLIRALPQNRAEWYAFIAVLLALGQFLLTVHPPGGSTPPPQPRVSTINVILPEDRAPSMTPTRRPNRPSTPRVRSSP